MRLSDLQGSNTPLLYTVRMAARSVGAITSNSVTNSISVIHILAASDGTATLPYSSIVIIVRFIPCEFIWRNVRLPCSRKRICRFQVSCSSPVGSVNNAFPLYSGRFSLTCPRTVLTRLHVYGSPSVTSSYLTHLWIFALHSAHTTKVFLCI